MAGLWRKSEPGMFTDAAGILEGGPTENSAVLVDPEDVATKIGEEEWEQYTRMCGIKLNDIQTHWKDTRNRLFDDKKLINDDLWRLGKAKVTVESLIDEEKGRLQSCPPKLHDARRTMMFAHTQSEWHEADKRSDEVNDLKDRLIDSIDFLQQQKTRLEHLSNRLHCMAIEVAVALKTRQGWFYHEKGDDYVQACLKQAEQFMYKFESWDHRSS